MISLGLTAPEIRWQLRRRLSVVLPGIYRLNRGALEAADRLTIALLLGGPRSVISGDHAARRHGVTAAGDTGPIDVLIPVNQAPRTVHWVRLRRSCITDPSCCVLDGMRWVSPARAVAETALWSGSPRRTRAVVIEAAQRRVAHPREVSAWIELLNRRHSVAVRRAVSEAGLGAWSVPEADLAELVAQSPVLPEPLLNPSLRRADLTPLTTPDMWFDDVAMAVMVHSRAHHAGALEWEKTVSQDGDLIAHGIVCVGVTPAAIRDSPDATRHRIEQTYLTCARSGRRRPPLVVTPRTP